MRRRKLRKLGFNYNNQYFKPQGVPLSQLNEINISSEELEALRLRYIEKKSQNDSAKSMNISQSQYQRDLTSSLEKIVNALIEGQAICIDKGV